MAGRVTWWREWAFWLLTAPFWLLCTAEVGRSLLHWPLGVVEGLGQVTYLLTSVAAAGLSWHAARVSRPLHPAVGLWWRYMAAGFGLLFLGDLCFTLSADPGFASLRPVAMLLYLAVYPVFLRVLLHLALQRVTRWLKLRLLVDMLAVTVTGAMVIWAMRLATASAGIPFSVAWITGAFAIGSLALVIATGLAVFEVNRDLCFRPQGWIMLGNLLLLFANLEFSEALIARGGLVGLNIGADRPSLIILAMGGRMTIAGAAYYGSWLARTGRLHVVSRGLALWMGNVMPYAGLISVTIYVWASVQGTGASLLPLFGAGVALTGLVLLRQYVVLHENTALVAQALQLAGSLEKSEARFRSVVQKSSDMVCIVNDSGRIQYASPAVETVLGYSAAELLGRPIAEYIHPDDVSGEEGGFRRFVASTGGKRLSLFRVLHCDGGVRSVEVAVNDLLEDHAVQGVVFNLRDVTDRVALEEQLKYQAFHDPLTGLANRALLRNRAGQALVRANSRGMRVALFLLDLDGFKLVNDTLGHGAGDRLLVAVGGRLVAALRPGDTVARLGGDEFAMLVEETEEQTAAAYAQSLLAAFSTPFEERGKELVVGASIGVAISGEHARSTDELVRNADLAMYRAKAAGKGCVRLFEPGMYHDMASRLDLEAEMRRALTDGEFELHYQPTVALDTGRISGVEALLRWQNPGRGMISPARFIPVAEETGLIVPLGRWVLRTACRQAKAWQMLAPERQHLSVAVNLSVRQLRDAGLAADVEQALAETGLAPFSLVLEITESIFLESTPATVDTLHRLRALGVRLAIDDFGTGYSSLAYLKRFPMDILKIDQSFVRALGLDDRDHDLMQGMLELARVLRLGAVAEGVEREEQREVLRRLGCPMAQGYLFARPAAAEQITELLAKELAGTTGKDAAS